MRVNRRRGQILTVMVSVAAVASFGSVVWWAHNQDVKAGGLRLRDERVHVGTGREVEREGDQRGRRRVADLLAAVAEARVVVAAERHQVQVVIEDEARGVVIGDGLIDAPAKGGEERLGAIEIGDRKVREEVHGSILAKSKCAVKRPPTAELAD